MENTIFNGYDSTLGYYSDIVKGYKKLMADHIEDGDMEELEARVEELKEIEEYKDYDGVLELSNNNGMGFTCSKYRDDWEVAKWVAENIAPEDDDAMPKIYNDYDRQKAFMEEVKEFMKGEN